MQTKEDTRRVVDLCSNYYSIIEEPVMIKNTNPNDNKKLDQIILFDESLYLYFNNEKFKEKFLLEFNQLDPNITIETSLCNSYLEFKRDPQNKVSNTKWI